MYREYNTSFVKKSLVDTGRLRSGSAKCNSVALDEPEIQIIRLCEMSLNSHRLKFTDISHTGNKWHTMPCFCPVTLHSLSR